MRITVSCLVLWLLTATTNAQWNLWASEGVSDAGNLARVNDYFFISNDAEGVKRSSDGGATWEDLSGWDGDAKSIFGFGGITLLGTTSGIYRSQDMGETWTNVRPNSESRHVHRFKSFGNHVFALFRGVQLGQGGGLFRSADQGLTWSSVSYTDEQVEDMVEHAGALFHAHVPTLARSIDGGATWSVHSDWIGPTSALVSNGTVLVSTNQYSPSTMYSTDGGAIWLNGPEELLGCSRSSDAVFYMGYFYGIFGGSVFRSVDGISWVLYNEMADECFSEYIRRLYFNSGELYAVGKSCVYRLSDPDAILDGEHVRNGYFFDVREARLRAISGDDRTIDLQIVDGSGRVLRNETGVRLSALKLAEDMAFGTYFLRIADQNGLHVLKAVLVR